MCIYGRHLICICKQTEDISATHTHTAAHTNTHTALSVNRQTCQDVEFVLPLPLFLLLAASLPIFFLPLHLFFACPQAISFSVVARLEFLIMLHFTAAQKKKKIIKQNKSQKQRRAGKKIFQTHIEVALIMRK